jgi:ribonuclease P/MRP protein subunit POP8
MQRHLVSAQIMHLRTSCSNRQIQAEQVPWHKSHDTAATTSRQCDHRGHKPQPQALTPSKSFPSTPSPSQPPPHTHTMAPEPPPNTDQPPSSAKPTKKPSSNPHILHQHTFRAPQTTNFHISLYPPSANLDTLLASQLLTQALSSYLGLTGAAIPIDILKLDSESGQVWIRVPRRDARAVRAGLGAWMGNVRGEKRVWRVRGEGLIGCVGEGQGIWEGE